MVAGVAVEAEVGAVGLRPVAEGSVDETAVGAAHLPACPLQAILMVHMAVTMLPHRDILLVQVVMDRPKECMEHLRRGEALVPHLLIGRYCIMSSVLHVSFVFCISYGNVGKCTMCVSTARQLIEKVR